MGYASRSGRARTSPTSPAAFGVCQRCGIWYNRRDLRNQYQWRGPTLQPTYIFVCYICYDVPQTQLRSIVVPADPVPVYLALPEPFIADEVDFMATTGGLTMITVDGVNQTKMPIGAPTGLDANAVMPLNGTVEYGQELSVLSITSLGNYTVSVTCSAPHGLSTNSQVAIEGVPFGEASGFYSVTVTSAMAFTYQILSILPIESLLTPTTRVTTCLVGLPYGYTQIPAVAQVTSGDGHTTPAVAPIPPIPPGSPYSLDFHKLRNTMYGGIIF